MKAFSVLSVAFFALAAPQIGRADLLHAGVKTVFDTFEGGKGNPGQASEAGASADGGASSAEPESGDVSQWMSTFSGSPNTNVVKMKFSKDLDIQDALKQAQHFSARDCIARNAKGDCQSTALIRFNHVLGGRKAVCTLALNMNALNLARTTRHVVIPAGTDLIVSGRRYLDKIVFQDNGYLHYMSCMPADETAADALSPREMALIAHDQLGVQASVFTGSGKGVKGFTDHGVPLEKYHGDKSRPGEGADPLSPVTLPNPDESRGFFWPVPGTRYVSSPFGPRHKPRHRMHKGVDIAVRGSNAILNKPIVATTQGKIIEVNNAGRDPWVSVEYLIKGQKYVFRYFHFAKLAPGVGVGSELKAGQSFAFVGNRGSVMTGPHLHLEVWCKNRPLNPLLLLKGTKLPPSAS